MWGERVRGREGGREVVQGSWMVLDKVRGWVRGREEAVWGDE